MGAPDKVLFPENKTVDPRLVKIEQAKDLLASPTVRPETKAKLAVFLESNGVTFDIAGRPPEPPSAEPDTQSAPEVGQQPTLAPHVSPAMAALRGFGQGASMYMGDEIGGGAAKIYDLLHGTDVTRVGRGVEGAPTGKSTFDVESGAQRAANTEAQTAHPGYYTGGNIIGNTALLVAPGAAASRSIPYVSAAMRALGTPFAAAGKAMGPALTDVLGSAAVGSAGAAADANPGERLQAAEQGAVAGGYLGMGGLGVQRVLSPIARAVGNAALRQRAAAALPPSAVTDLEIAGGHPAVEKVGQAIEGMKLQGSGSIPPPPLTYAKNAKAALAETGPAVGAAVDKAKAKIVDLTPVREMIQQQIDKLNTVMSPKAAAEAKRLQNQLNSMTAGQGVMELGNGVDFERAYNTKQYLADLGHTAAGKKNTVQAAQYRAWASAVNEAMQTSLRDDPALLEAYTTANANHSMALDIAKGAKAKAKAGGTVAVPLSLATAAAATGYGLESHGEGHEGNEYLSPAMMALVAYAIGHGVRPRLPSVAAGLEGAVGRGIQTTANMAVPTAASLAAPITREDPQQ